MGSHGGHRLLAYAVFYQHGIALVGYTKLYLGGIGIIGSPVYAVDGLELHSLGVEQCRNILGTSHAGVYLLYTEMFHIFLRVIYTG